MGRGIAMTIAAAGIPVIAVARGAEQLAKALQAIAKLWAGSVAEGHPVAVRDGHADGLDPRLA
jgi:3-hydroxyacyl-CoA dehydrogenase